MTTETEFKHLSLCRSVTLTPDNSANSSMDPTQTTCWFIKEQSLLRYLHHEKLLQKENFTNKFDIFATTDMHIQPRKMQNWFNAEHTSSKSSLTQRGIGVPQ